MQHIDPHSYGHNSVSFPFSWAALWDMVLVPASSLQLIWTPTATVQSGPEGPFCWVLVHSTASYLQLTWTSCRQGYIIIWRPPTSCDRQNFALNSTPRQSRLYPDIPRLDAPVIFTGAFPILTAWLGWRSIYNIFFPMLLENNEFKVTKITYIQVTTIL